MSSALPHHPRPVAPIAPFPLCWSCLFFPVSCAAHVGVGQWEGGDHRCQLVLVDVASPRERSVEDTMGRPASRTGAVDGTLARDMLALQMALEAFSRGDARVPYRYYHGHVYCKRKWHGALACSTDTLRVEMGCVLGTARGVGVGWGGVGERYRAGGRRGVRSLLGTSIVVAFVSCEPSGC